MPGRWPRPAGWGAYRPAHRLSDAQRHVRGRLTVRDALVRTRTGYISVIRARLRQDGWRVARGSADGFIRRVLALALPGRLLSELAPLLAVMRQVNQQLAYSDDRIAQVARVDTRVERVQSVPSVGPVTAAAFVAALDDAGRFTRAHQVEAYLGLVPREWSSGEGQRRGRITKAGDRRVRSWLVQVAVSIRRVRHPATIALRDWAERLAARRGRFIAVVALARRLAGILYALFRDGTRYDPTRVRPASRAVAASGGPSRIRTAMRPSGLAWFDGWVSACVSLATVRAPQRRWRPHPSTPLLRRRASLATPSANRSMMNLARLETAIRRRGTKEARGGT
jgi:transposase